MPLDGTSVSSARVTPKNVMTGPTGLDEVGVAVGEGFGVRVDVGVVVAVGVAVLVRVVVAVRDGEGVRVAVGVGVRVEVGGALVGVRVNDGVRVGDAVPMGVGVALRLKPVTDGEADGVGVAVALPANVGVAVTAVDARVGDGVSEGVGVAVRPSVGVAETDDTDVAARVGAVDAVAVAVDEGLDVGVPATAVALRRAVGVGVAVAVRVGARSVDVTVGVAEGRTVGVAVRVTVGVTVAVSVGVNVGGAGPEPTRTTSCCSGPRLPAVSRKRTLITVSPAGNCNVWATAAQNWTRVWASTKRAVPNPSCVHAALGEVAATKWQAKSFSALAMNCVGPKSGGLTAGTPPSHTAMLPSPRGLLLSICTSGRCVGFFASRLSVTTPGGWPDGPEVPSTTSWNPAPELRK